MVWFRLWPLGHGQGINVLCVPQLLRTSTHVPRSVVGRAYNWRVNDLRESLAYIFVADVLQDRRFLLALALHWQSP